MLANHVIDGKTVLTCPICGSWNTHLENVVETRNDDDRPCVSLSFSCELGCSFCIQFNQHEGLTFCPVEGVSGEVGYSFQLLHRPTGPFRPRLLTERKTPK